MCIYKEGWCVGLIQGGSSREVEGNCLKYLKGGGIEKRVVKTKIKNRGQAGSRGEA